MKTTSLLLALSILAFTSCTAVYKTGQTPDDVYFSPTRPQDEYVQVDRRDDRRYESDDDYYDDRYLRMRVSNRNRWSELDDWYYYGNRYNYYYYPTTSFYYNPWTPNIYWNTFYNPYYSNGYYGNPIFVKPSTAILNRPRTTNLNTYNTNLLTNRQYANPSKVSGNSNNNNIFNRANAAGSRNGNAGYNNNSNTRSTNGSALRNVFGNNNSSNNSSNNSNAPSRSSTPSSSSSSSSTPAGSSNAPIRRF